MVTRCCPAQWGVAPARRRSCHLEKRPIAGQREKTLRDVLFELAGSVAQGISIEKRCRVQEAAECLHGPCPLHRPLELPDMSKPARRNTCSWGSLAMAASHPAGTRSVAPALVIHSRNGSSIAFRHGLSPRHGPSPWIRARLPPRLQPGEHPLRND
jgi:hypothetical protein